ncbi:hypothetical protein OESDEN_19227 [Oesophagostomum dentatum]|uniref:Uncharacterized protein n=1 Tax=Oesophagostomum dentatum TaxID=61180 RepID=A0A0B1S841_OESDE|nr:hypothetical protein OESDEN_19227 [Oesophagostomum dentatum]
MPDPPSIKSTSRAAAGVPSRVILHRQPLKPIYEEHIANPLSDLSAPTQRISYPDYSRGLFPEATNHAQPVFHHPTSVQTVERNEHNKSRARLF